MQNLDTNKKIAIGVGIAATTAVVAALLYSYFNADADDEPADEQPPSPKSEKEGVPDPVDALKKQGNKAFSERRYDDAIKYYTEALELDDKNQHLLFSNRSASYLAKRDYENALGDANRTIDSNPSWSKGYYRKGKVLEPLRRFSEAFTEYYRGSRLEESNQELKNLMEALIPVLPPGELDTRSTLDKEMIRHHFKQLSDKHSRSLNISLSAIESAARSATSISELHSQFPGVTSTADRVKLGLVLTNIIMDDDSLDEERTKLALDVATATHNLNPHDLDTNIALINAKLRNPNPPQSDLEEAFKLTRAALTIDPQNTILIHTYAAIILRLLSSSMFEIDVRNVLKDLSLGLANPGANHLLIADCGIRLWFKLFEDAEIAQKLQQEEQYNAMHNVSTEQAYLAGVTSGAFSKILPEPFFVDALAKVAFNNPGLEKLLIPCRSAFLLLDESGTPQITNDQNLKKRTALIYALANQCYRTNYAWATNGQDDSKVSEHLMSVAELLTADEGLVNNGLLDETLAYHMLMISLFKPLHEIPNILKVVKEVNLNLIHPYWSQILQEPLRWERENQLETQVTVVGNPADTGNGDVVSIWDSAGLVAGRLCQVRLQDELSWIFPTFNKFKLADRCRALVVECGSGQEVYQMAQLYSNVHVTGMDSSRRNIAYAERQLADLKVQKTEAEVVVGDVNEFDVNPFSEGFHFVVATNVLHYSKNPEQTLRNLTKQLNSGGAIRISVFAEHHVSAVAAGRSFLKDQGMSDLFTGHGSLLEIKRKPTPEEVARARNMILDSDNRDMDVLVMSPQFYTLASFEELMFSPHLRSFNFRDIGKLLQAVGLELVGYEFPGTQQHYVLRYRVDYPEDPNFRNYDFVDEFDKKHPEAFRQFTNAIQFVAMKP